MSVLADVVAAVDPALAQHAVPNPGHDRFAPLVDDPDRLFTLEAVYEGYLLHYGAPRAFAGMDQDLRLLGGDALYALGLSRLAERGDVDAVAALADLISAAARAQAEGDPERAESLWIDTARRLGGGRPPGSTDALALPKRLAKGTYRLRLAVNHAGLGTVRRTDRYSSRRPSMAPPDNKRKSRYTKDRNVPGAFEGETMTRRHLMTGGALAVGGIATAAFALPALGFALGPMFEDTTPDRWQDVGPEADFSEDTYVPKVISLVADIGDAGKTTTYVRKFNPKRDSLENDNDKFPYIAMSTRCVHLGCPVRYFQASQKFVCPCHGGVYNFEGRVDGGPPVRPLDRFETRVRNGRVELGERFSVNSELERFSPRDPSNHLDGLWEYLYPARPST